MRDEESEASTTLPSPNDDEHVIENNKISSGDEVASSCNICCTRLKQNRVATISCILITIVVIVVVGLFVGDTTATKPDEVSSESPVIDDTASVCGDGLVSGSEQCDDGNTVNDDGCSSNCTYEQSCDIQLYNLMNPTPERLAANTQYYLEDFFAYSADPLNFLTQRAADCGRGGLIYASLGKLIIGDYSVIADLMNKPQKRGWYLGRGRLDPSRLPPNFLLQLDDPEIESEQGESRIHQILHDFAWYDTIGKASARIADDSGETKDILESFISRLITEVAAANGDDEIIKNSVEQFICRYLMKAFFDLDYDDTQVAGLQALWLTPGYALPGLFAGLVPDEDWANIEPQLAMLTASIAASPSMEDYTSSDENFNLSKEEWANELMYVFGIAGLGGGANLVRNLFTKIPSDYYIDSSNHDELANAVLEAGRIKAPVNNANLILEETTYFKIGEEQLALPANTTVALSMGLGSVDESVFPDATTFDHTRENLISSILNYNMIGFADGVGTRACVGRNIAVKMAMNVLKAWLESQNTLSSSNSTRSQSPSFRGGIF